MNQKIIFLLSAASIFSNISLSANSDSIMIITINNNEPLGVPMNLEINGTIKLYSVLKSNADEKTEILQVTSDVDFINWVLNPDKDFYIGSNDKEAEIITPSNFKRLAKEYFAAIPELADNVGKRGFRYKNLPSMILFYNKMMTKEEGLTKEDILKR